MLEGSEPDEPMTCLRPGGDVTFTLRDMMELRRERGRADQRRNWLTLHASKGLEFP